MAIHTLAQLQAQAHALVNATSHTADQYQERIYGLFKIAMGGVGFGFGCVCEEIGLTDEDYTLPSPEDWQSSEHQAALLSAIARKILPPGSTT